MFPSTEAVLLEARSGAFAGCISATANLNADLCQLAWAKGDKAPGVAFRFAANADDEKLQELRKEKAVRLRGTLNKISTEGTTVWADFTDLVIEGKRP